MTEINMYTHKKKSCRVTVTLEFRQCALGHWRVYQNTMKGLRDFEPTEGKLFATRKAAEKFLKDKGWKKI